MTINNQIRDGKPWYDINRETVKISALSSGKIHKYEYFTGEDILPSNQQQIIEQAKFTYSSLGKAFEKPNKNNWRSRPKTNWCFRKFENKKKKQNRLRINLIISQKLQLFLMNLLTKEKI